MKTKSELNSPGIYKIINPKNNKAYVGSAFNIRKRWKAHRTALRHNRHINRYLQSTANKYGLKNLIWKVIEYVPPSMTKKETGQLLVTREQYWINKTKSYDRTRGYNLSPTAGSPLGVKHTPESRKRMSESHLGNRHTKEAKIKISESQYKKVYQICIKTGKVLNGFSSVVCASKETGIQKTGISMCCRNVIRQSGGFFWTYNVKSFKRPQLKRKVIERPWKRKPVSNGKKVWESVNVACRELNFGWNVFKNKINTGELFYV